jgi:hypothetical protein
MVGPSIFPILIASSILLANAHNIMSIFQCCCGWLLETFQQLGNFGSETCSIAITDVWNHTLSKLEENLMNIKLLGLIFDGS